MMLEQLDSPLPNTVLERGGGGGTAFEVQALADFLIRKNLQ